jgi:protein-L-isoaspartate(D-aspartate) O-methyltransferase
MREDSYIQQGLRRGMVEKLRQGGITDETVLRAMTEVPRHWFIGIALDAYAYEDRALQIDCDQTISRPSTVAMQSQLLALKPNMKVLEIGTGSGYQTAVLCRMGAQVFTIERQKGLFDKTTRVLKECGYRAKCFLGDGYQGLAGSYDRIIVTCGAPEIPQTLMGQLKTGGIMVIPLGEGEQEMMRITKEGPEREEWRVENFGTYSFVPMLDGDARVKR